MAIVTATEIQAFGFTTPTGPSENSTISGAEHETLGCYVTLEWTSGTYAQADDATFNPATAIQDSLRDGKTITVLSASLASAGRSAAGPIVGGGLVSGVAANVVTLPLVQEDLTTEYADATGVPAAWDRPICMYVVFHRPINA